MSPAITATTANANPAHGPATPTSINCRRSTIGLRRRMNAPNVPMKFQGGGPGRKYGGDASIP